MSEHGNQRGPGVEIGVLGVAAQGRWERYSGYIHELLAHAGLPYRSFAEAQLHQELPRLAVLVIPTDAALEEASVSAIEGFARAGGAVVGLGGTSGLDGLFGCVDKGPLPEGWVSATGQHRVTAGMSGPLHAHGGRLIAPVANDVEILGNWLEGERWSEQEGWSGAELGAAITVRPTGSGCALLIAADLVHSVLRIQQGIAVHVDGRPAADGSAKVDDGILKADDGIALDYERDRELFAGVRWFTRPIADMWRDLLVRALLWSALRQGASVPMLWYWPQALPAVGQISHDTDNNVPYKAEILFELLAKAGIPSTWCLQYPGGYAPDFYPRLREAGHEIALHFDAHSHCRRTRWLEEDFVHQLDWLLDMAGGPVNSNKNHYLRWEGLSEFLLWLERRGIKSDQSKGPSKKGNKGFLFGSSHPWFPVEEQSLRSIDVLEVPLHAQDLTDFCPYEVGPAIIDQAVAHGGSAHLLFHPGRTEKPKVAQALLDVVAYGRERGLAWWTNDQIQAWERSRREVRFSPEQTPSGVAWSIDCAVPLEGATVLVFEPDSAGSHSAFGFAAHRQVHTLEPGTTVSLARRKVAGGRP